MQRILTRVSLRSARPRDFTRLCASLNALPVLNEAINSRADETLAAIAARIDTYP